MKNINGKIVNIVGSIEAKKAPKGAQFCKLNPDKSFIEMFYRIDDNQLQYFSSCGSGWMGTNERDPARYLKEKEFFYFSIDERNA